MKKTKRNSNCLEPVICVADPSHDSAWPKRTVFDLGVVLLIGLMAYANTFSVPFVFDDQSSILNNPVIKDLPKFLTIDGYSYNPQRFIGYLSFALNYHFGGLDVFGYHLVNLTIHIANGFLVYTLARLVVNTASTVNGEQGIVGAEESHFTPYIPLCASLLFVSHPVQTQAVTYIVQRLASLATFFYLSSVVCYAYGRHWALGSGLWARGNGKTPFSPFTIHRSPFTWYFLTLIFGLLAIKTKEIAFTLPLAIILYEFCFFGFSRRKLLLLLAQLGLVVMVAVVEIVGSDKALGDLLSDVTEMSRETTIISRADYLITQFSVIATYLRLLVFPVSQNLDYDYPVYHSLLALRPLLGLFLICTLLGWAILAWRNKGRRVKSPESSLQTCILRTHYSLLSFGILWFFLTLSVESSIIPIKDVIFEHRLYLPSVGFFMAAVSMGELAITKMSLRLVLGAGALLVLILSGATFGRNRVWGDEALLWGDVLGKSPYKARPSINLGHAMMQRGKLDDAIKIFEGALKYSSNDVRLLNNLGQALFSMGKKEDAIVRFREALALDPESTPVHNNLSNILQQQGMLDEAQKHLETVIRLNPQLAEAHVNMGVLLARRKDYDAAIQQYLKALSIKPDEGNVYFNLGVAYDVKNRFNEAIDSYQRALQLLPDDVEILTRLGKTCLKVERFDEAMIAYERSSALRPDIAELHKTLGAIYSMKGKTADALLQYQQALRINPEDGDVRAKLLCEQKRFGSGLPVSN